MKNLIKEEQIGAWFTDEFCTIYQHYPKEDDYDAMAPLFEKMEKEKVPMVRILSNVLDCLFCLKEKISKSLNLPLTPKQDIWLDNQRHRKNAIGEKQVQEIGDESLRMDIGCERYV